MRTTLLLVVGATAQPLYTPCGDISSQPQRVDDNVGGCDAGLMCALLSPENPAYYTAYKRAKECVPDTNGRSFPCGEGHKNCNDGVACAANGDNWVLEGRTCSEVQCPEPAPLVTVFEVELAFSRAWSAIQVGSNLYNPSHSLANLGAVESADFFPGGFGSVMVRLTFHYNGDGAFVCTGNQKDAIALKVVGTVNVCPSRVSVGSCDYFDGHEVVMVVKIGATAARGEGQTCGFGGGDECAGGLECACVGPCKAAPAGLGQRTCVGIDACAGDTKTLVAATVEQALSGGAKASDETGGSIAVLVYGAADTAKVAAELGICPSRVTVRSKHAAFTVLEITGPAGCDVADSVAGKYKKAIADDCAPEPPAGACGEWGTGKCSGAKTLLGNMGKAACLSACKGYKCCVSTGRGKCRASNGRVVGKGYASAAVPCY